MERRRYLGLVGSGVGVGLAGCSSSPSGQQAESTATETPTSTAEPASFELVSVSAPSEVEIGQTATYSFTVRNTGGQSGEFSTLIQTRYADEEYGEGREWSETIPAGEEVTLQSQDFEVNVLTTLYIRFDEFDREVEVDVVSRRLPFGRYYTTPDKILMTAYQLQFDDTIEYSADGFDYELTPDQGNKFLRVWVNVENQSGQPYYVSSQSAFSVLVGNSQYDTRFETRIDGYYEGGQIQPGIVRDGWLLFEVPRSVSSEDVTLAWTKQYIGEIISVYWDNSL